MPALKLCVLAGSAWLQFAASAMDELCLVQKDIQREQPALATASKELMAPMLLAATKRLPLVMQRNISEQDVIRGAVDILSLFRDRALVQGLYVGLSSTSAAAINFSKVIGQSAHNLSYECQKATPQRALFLLESYLLHIDDAMAWFLASMAMSISELLQVMPAGQVRTNLLSAFPQLPKLSNVTHSTVYSFFDVVFRPNTKELFGERTAFCKQYPWIKKNATVMDDFLSKVVSTLQEAQDKIETVKPYVINLMPAVAEEFVQFSNISLDANSKIAKAVSFAYHMMVKAVIEVAENKVGCAVSNATSDPTSKEKTGSEGPLPSLRSSSPNGHSRAGRLLASAAVAAAAVAFTLVP